jgi:hypothetical protein
MGPIFPPSVGRFNLLDLLGKITPMIPMMVDNFHDGKVG